MNPIIYGLIVTLFGMGIVFLVLIGLWGILAMMKGIFGGKKQQNKTNAAVQSENAAVVPQHNIAAEEDSDELIAVITAAIAASMGSQSNIFIKKITRIGDNAPVWGQIGRHEQMLNRL